MQKMIDTLKRWIRKSVFKDRIAAGELERRSKFRGGTLGIFDRFRG